MKKVPAIYVVNNQQLMNIEITPLTGEKYLANGSTLQSVSYIIFHLRICCVDFDLVKA
jgi:hypothetical protein